MNIEANQEQFLEEMSLLKSDLISALSSVNVEKYRADFKGRYSSDRFKEYFVEKVTIHMVFKYVLIRMIEESMSRVKVKLNQEGLKQWREMSKNFREDYNVLFDFAVTDIKREQDFKEIFRDTIFDDDHFINHTDRVFNKHIPILAKYNFSSLNENTTLNLIESLYSSKGRDEINNFYQPSPIINFLLQQLGLV